jgi:hypothetical protein
MTFHFAGPDRNRLCHFRIRKVAVSIGIQIHDR